MQTIDIKQLIETALPETTAIVESPDNVHFTVIVISPLFADKSKLQQQRIIYALLDEKISSGEIHALSLKTYTPEMWQN